MNNNWYQLGELLEVMFFVMGLPLGFVLLIFGLDFFKQERFRVKRDSLTRHFVVSGIITFSIVVIGIIVSMFF